MLIVARVPTSWFSTNFHPHSGLYSVQRSLKSFFSSPLGGEKRKRDFFRKNTCEAGLASTIQKLKSQIFFIQCPINVSDSTMIQRKVSDGKYLKVDPGILRIRRAQCPSFDAHQWWSGTSASLCQVCTEHLLEKESLPDQEGDSWNADWSSPTWVLGQGPPVRTWETQNLNVSRLWDRCHQSRSFRAKASKVTLEVERQEALLGS